MSRGRIGATVLTLAALIASHGAWAQRSSLPADCRQELVRQCAGSDNRQACLRRAIQTLPDHCRKAVSDVQAARAPALGAAFRELAFGSDPRQKLDIAVPAGATAKAPLLVYVHGGGWSMGDKRHGARDKANHFLRSGWAFATTNYRLVPDARVEDQAADIAAAVALLRRQPGVDGNRIVLMGHSAGAHLVSLVGTDPTYLQAAGVPLSAVKGVVPLDGAGYDVPAQIDLPGNRVRGAYVAAFGTELERQRKLSPTLQAGAWDAPDWLILPVASRRDSTAQSQALAAALQAGGSRATVAPQPGKTHKSLNQELGVAGDPATAVVDAFLKALR